MMGYRFPPLGRAVFEAFFRHLPPEGEVELFPGARVEMNFRDDTQKATYWQGRRFEHPAIRNLDKWIRTDAVFFDIGANYGFYSYWMLSRNGDVQVHAFDPLPDNVERMKQSRGRNGWESRFNIVESALGDSEKSMTLHVGAADSGHSTFGNHPGLAGKALDVTVMPFDNWLARAGLSLPPEPRWIAKIDVEGFECHVLRGMDKTLRARAFAGLMVEINPYTLSLFGVKPGDVFAWLYERGYVSGERDELAGAKPGDCQNAFFVPVVNQKVKS